MLTIPEIQVKSAIEYLLQVTYNDYKYINQVYITGVQSLTNGFDWHTTPQNFNINGTEIEISTKSTNVATTLTVLNAALINKNITTISFAQIPNTNFIYLKTDVNTTAVQTVILSDTTSANDEIYNTIGIYKGTYSGKDTTHSILYQYFYGNVFDRYDYYTEIIKLLNDSFSIKKAETNNLRSIKLRTDWNPNPDNKPPIIVISLNNEQETAKVLGTLGTINTLNDYEEYKEKQYMANMKLVIISDNKNECILLYNFLKAILKANVESLYEYNIINLTVSGGDLFAEIESPNMFSQSLQIAFVYSTTPIVSIDKGNVNAAFNLNLTMTLD